MTRAITDPHHQRSTHASDEITQQVSGTQTSATTASETCRLRTRIGMLMSARGLTSVVRLNIYTTASSTS